MSWSMMSTQERSLLPLVTVFREVLSFVMTRFSSDIADMLPGVVGLIQVVTVPTDRSKA